MIETTKDRFERIKTLYINNDRVRLFNEFLQIAAKQHILLFKKPLFIKFDHALDCIGNKSCIEYVSAEFYYPSWFIEIRINEAGEITTGVYKR
mgnify:CR=1 FL=1